MLGKSDSVDYSAISQINTGLMKVEVTGAGVKLVAKSMNRKDEFVRALNDRRQRGHNTPDAAAPAASDDPVALLKQLGELHDAGVLSEEEFVAKKAELLGRL